MIIAGLAIVFITVYLLVRQYEARMVLLTAGIMMASLAGNPLAAFDAFAKNMVISELILAICPVMGFAYVMKATECDQHLIKLVAGGLKRVRPVLIPAATVGTFLINIALPSAAGTAAAVGAIFIPLQIAAGVHPAMAGASVMAGTFGSMLNPGLPHNPFVARLAQTEVMNVIAVHSAADIIAGLIGAISLTVVAFLLKEHQGYAAVEVVNETETPKKSFQTNHLYAIVPMLPVLLLLLGAASIVPLFKKLAVPHTMVIGSIIGIIVTRKDPQQIVKSFFKGMGSSYGEIMGIIIAAGVFVGGMTSIGLVNAFIQSMINSTDIVRYAATFGPFILAVISGSGNAAAFAFNEAVTPYASQFGLEIINMGSTAALAGCLGRTMSPISGVAIICAAIAGVSPLELAKRNAPGMIISSIVIMFVLL